MQLDNNSIFYKKVLVETIKKYRLSIIVDPKSRLKTKIACLLSYFGFDIFIKKRG
jgi:hypothetical protein